MPRISILNYGMGNIRSVRNALNYIGVESEVIDSPEEVLTTQKLILPGVGSFRLAMENLKRKNLLFALNEVALKKKIPILGICLGMQLLAEKGEEGGETDGLAWIPGIVSRFPAESLKIKLPHVGFNTVYFQENSNNILFNGLSKQADFYFVHSYRLICEDNQAIAGRADYGERFVAAVWKENIYGVQFHPEKSQINGLIVLRNFGCL